VTTLKAEGYTIPAADLGAENPLPNFREPAEDFFMPIDPRATDEERKFVGWRAARRVLPYRMQDGYSRNRKPRTFKSFVLENEHLKATFLPELGGRMVSLFNKDRNLELLEKNPVFQPANLSLRNAWFSGGVEWNTTVLGHYFMTCAPVFAAQISGLQGEPALRLYEWDRVKCFPWQIDFHLPPGSKFLFVRVRLINPHPMEMPMYWWSNIAVEETPQTRVLIPAETAFQHNGNAPLDIMPMPTLEGRDIMYARNVDAAREIYFRIADGQRPWVAAVNGDGRGLIQASTARLQGRKLFYWGMNAGGRNWQRYLSEPGRNYLEIQAGLGKIQPTCIPMPADTEWTWTEAYGLLEADPKKVHSTNWTEAWQTAQSVLDAAIPQDRLTALNEELAKPARLAPKEVLFTGTGWGALERKRLAAAGKKDKIPAELVFDAKTLGAEQQPWLKLLESGALPAVDAKSGDPGQFMIQAEWLWTLERGLQAGKGDHWHARYQQGVAQLESNDVVGARKSCEASIKHTPTAWAYRLLAVIERRDGNLDKGLELLKKAWQTGPQVSALAIEYAQALTEAQRFEELRAFCAGLPDPIRGHERILIAQAHAALKTGHYDEVEPIFKYPFATIREGEATLAELWFAWHAARIAKTENVPNDKKLMERVVTECPVPANIDFRIILEIK
jgi:hypothetical protein